MPSIPDSDLYGDTESQHQIPGPTYDEVLADQVKAAYADKQARAEALAAELAREAREDARDERREDRKDARTERGIASAAALHAVTFAHELAMAKLQFAHDEAMARLLLSAAAEIIPAVVAAANPRPPNHMGEVLSALLALAGAYLQGRDEEEPDGEEPEEDGEEPQAANAPADPSEA